jgi:monoamine oxidase
MLEIAIVGGGLTGLAVANLLRTEGKDFRLFEARSRLGGRIFTVEEPSGLALDLGPTWFWPAENPLLAASPACRGRSARPAGAARMHQAWRTRRRIRH